MNNENETPGSVIVEVTLELNRLMANEFVLYNKTKNFYWHVEGNGALTMRKLYVYQFKQLDEIIDAIAQQIRAIGQCAEARLKAYLDNAYLIEQGYVSKDKDQLRHLLRDHQSIISNLKKASFLFGQKHKDQKSRDFINGLVEQHEKMVWFLQAFMHD